MRLSKSNTTVQSILDYSVSEFATSEIRNVSIESIAKKCHMTPQGVYRYFKGRAELLHASFEYDLNQLHSKTLSEYESHPMPFMTGEIWYKYSEMAAEHPLVVKIFKSGDPVLLNFAANAEGTKRLMAKLENDILTGQKYGIVRNDINVPTIMESAGQIFTHQLLPLVLQGEYGSPEWLRISAVVVGNMFHPLPDLTTPNSRAAFEAKMSEIIQRIAAEQNV